MMSLTSSGSTFASQFRFSLVFSHQEKNLQILNVTCKSVLNIKLSQITWCLVTCRIPAKRFWFDSGTVIKVQPSFPSSMVNPDVSGRKDLPRRGTSGLRNRLFSPAYGWTATCGRFLLNTYMLKYCKTSVKEVLWGAERSNKDKFLPQGSIEHQKKKQQDELWQLTAANTGWNRSRGSRVRVSAGTRAAWYCCVWDGALSGLPSIFKKEKSQEKSVKM